MNKIFKKLIILFVIVCTISSISFAAVTRPKEAKGTILGGDGTVQNPYQLVMGEGLIDIYYEKETDVREIWFRFVKGDYNAGNYLVENNADKKRIRFTLIGTDEASLRVTSYEGENYLQAGAKTVKLDANSDYKNMQKPFYQITANEAVYSSSDKYDWIEIGGYIADTAMNGYNHSNYQSLQSDLQSSKSFDLANGYLNESLITNISAYSTSYVFSKTGLDYSEAYIDDNKVENNTDEEKKWVTISYCFKGTTTESIEEEAGALESLGTKIMLSIGDVFVKVSKIGGSKTNESYVSIDTLVFNEYPNTIVNFFGDTNYLNKEAQGIIRTWYNIFKAWAIIAYILLLIYMGIKVVLYSGTSEQKKYKGMLEGWLQGVLILFILPFFFKYIIEINDVIVDVIRTNSKYSVHAYYTFEYLYENDQEDGEDSTTTVLEKLKKEEKYLKDKLEELNIDDIEEKYQETISKFEETENKIKNAKTEIGTKLGESFNKILTMHGMSAISYNDKIITWEEMEKNIIDLVEQCKTKEEYNKKIEELKSKITVIKIGGYGGETIDIATTLLKSGIDAISNEIGVYYEQMEKYKEYEKEKEALEKEIEETKTKIAKIKEAKEFLKDEDTDLLGNMRIKASTTEKLLYAIIWIVMVFEIIFLLILYYKRLFMLMVLIIIFPLVCVAYVYEKTKGGRAKILSNWIQEFIVNVFIQSIHAILYVTIVEAGYSVYLADDQNWLIYFVAVIALLTVESVFKHMLGMKSSTVTDLTNYGSTAIKIGTTAVVAGAAKIGNVRANAKEKINDAIGLFARDPSKSFKLSDAQKKIDRMTETIRKHRDNRIMRNKKLSEEKKRAKLEKKHKADKKRDKLKLTHRKIARGAKKTFKVVKKVGRGAVKTGALMGTVAGGLAAGGDFNDFMKASSVAKGIIGPDKKPEETEDHIGKIKNKVVGDLFGDKPTTTNTGTVDVPGGSSSTGTENSAGPVVETQNPMVSQPETRREARLANCFRNRLQEQNVYIRKNYDIEEEEKEG